MGLTIVFGKWLGLWLPCFITNKMPNNSFHGTTWYLGQHASVSPCHGRSDLAPEKLPLNSLWDERLCFGLMGARMGHQTHFVLFVAPFQLSLTQSIFTQVVTARFRWPLSALLIQLCWTIMFPSCGRLSYPWSSNSHALMPFKCLPEHRHGMLFYSLPSLIMGWQSRRQGLSPADQADTKSLILLSQSPGC